LYAWRDTNNRYIERFREEYEAATSFLVDNYRSSRHIIATANHLIGCNPGRLKDAYPIRIDRGRQGEPGGGAWEARDLERQGRVMRLAIDPGDSASGNLQAQAAVRELKRLLQLDDGNWNGCAILSRAHQYLWPVQALCEQAGIPYFLAADKESALPITRQRGFMAVADHVRLVQESLSAADVWQRVAETLNEDWSGFFQDALIQLKIELGDCQLNGAAIVDWLYEYAREMRQQPKRGLYLGTVHSAKGLEFRHVVLLDGGWRAQADGLNDERRLYYVGMTRAEQTLTLCEFSAANPFSGGLSTDILCRSFTGAYNPGLEKRYLQLRLKDIDLGFAGRSPESDPIHETLRQLRPGAALQLRPQGERYLILDDQGRVVGRTSRSFRLELNVEQCEVAGILVRFADDSEEPYRASQKSERWELAVPRVSGVPLTTL
jgi:ATP-dependent DNA helicase RecQ